MTTCELRVSRTWCSNASAVREALAFWKMLENCVKLTNLVSSLASLTKS